MCCYFDNFSHFEYKVACEKICSGFFVLVVMVMYLVLYEFSDI